MNSLVPPQIQDTEYTLTVSYDVYKYGKCIQVCGVNKWDNLH